MQFSSSHSAFEQFAQSPSTHASHEHSHADAESSPAAAGCSVAAGGSWDARSASGRFLKEAMALNDFAIASAAAPRSSGSSASLVANPLLTQSSALIHVSPSIIVLMTSRRPPVASTYAVNMASETLSSLSAHSRMAAASPT